MESQQLCLFKFERPLLNLFGRDFFQNVPRSPGVYVFLGEGRRVLYVGQSKNLRLRLGYYKNAQPEREPRRIIRLVHQTKEIELHPCDSAGAAKLREVELIQEYRPRFNVQHALSRTYSFFGLREGDERFHVRLSLDEQTTAGETLIGAFKNRGLCRRALFALGRTDWAYEQRPSSIYDFPMSLMDRTRVQEVTLSVKRKTTEEVGALCRGESPGFASRSERLVHETEDAFLRELYERDYLVLVEFYELAARMRKLREQSGFTRLLPPREIDRSLVSQGSHRHG